MIHYVGCKHIVIQLEMLKLTIMRINCSKLSNNLLRETVEVETIKTRLHNHLRAILPRKSFNWSFLSLIYMIYKELYK